MRASLSALFAALVFLVGYEASAQEAMVGTVKQAQEFARGNRVVMVDGTTFKLSGHTKNQLIATHLIAPGLLAVIPDAEPADSATKSRTPARVPLVVMAPGAAQPTGAYVVLYGTSATEGPADSTLFTAQRVDVAQLQPGHQVAILGAEPVAIVAEATTQQRTFLLPDGREITVADTANQAPPEMEVALIDPDAPVRPGGWIFITRRGDEGYVLSGVPSTEGRPGVAITGTVERVSGQTVTLTDYPALKIGRDGIVFVTQRGTEVATVKPGSTVALASATATTYPSALPAGMLVSGRVVEVRVIRSIDTPQSP